MDDPSEKADPRPLGLLERILEGGGGGAAEEGEDVMRVRDSWLLEDHYFDEPSDWVIAPELKPLVRDDIPEDAGFRSLLEDPEVHWDWRTS
jgi:hypothetical protein